MAKAKKLALAKFLTARAEMRSAIGPSLSFNLFSASVACQASSAIGIQRLREIATISIDVLVLLIEGRSTLKNSALKDPFGNVDQLKVFLFGD